jgi:hypothetical protein
MISELFWQCSTSYMISELLWQCSISYIISELFWQCGIFLHDYGTVLKVWYFSTWCRNCSDSVVFLDVHKHVEFRNHVEKYHTVRIVQKWCRKYYTVRTVQKSCRKYYTVRTVPKSCRKYYTFFLHDYGTVLKVWYFSTWCRNCSDSVVFLDMISELFWQVPKSCRKYYTFRTIRKSCRKYYTVKTIPKSCWKIPDCQNSSEIISKNTTLSTQFRNPVEKYNIFLHDFWTVLTV